MDEKPFDFNSEAVKKSLFHVQSLIGRRLRMIVDSSMLDLQKDMRTNRFVPYSGSSQDGVLQRRSGHLSNSIRVKPSEVQGDIAVGGLTIGKIYGHILIGKRGKVTTITPQKSQYLAIPLPAALDAHGVARGAPRDNSVWGSTFIFKGIIFGKKLYVQGKHKGEEKFGLLPLFVLKRSVDVKVKIAAEDLIDFVKPIVHQGIQTLKGDLGLK